MKHHNLKYLVHQEEKLSRKTQLNNIKKATGIILLYVFAAIGFIAVLHQAIKWIYNY